MTDLRHGDCRELLKTFDPDVFDSCVTDPPYGISFMANVVAGKKTTWDSKVPGVDYWKEVYRVLKPGAYLLAFCGTKTYHRLACAIEDSGFEIVDQIGWIYSQGFPKLFNLDKALDKRFGTTEEREVIGTKILHGNAAVPTKEKGGTYVVNCRTKASKEVKITRPAHPTAKEWEGWGTGLKPSLEPICVARKPLSEKNLVDNTLIHGTGCMNLAESAVVDPKGNKRTAANLLIDDVCDLPWQNYFKTCHFTPEEWDEVHQYFYCPKPNQTEANRDYNSHITVKPVSLMIYLIRLVTRKGGMTLDPFVGSGTSGMAAKRLGLNFVGLDNDPTAIEVAERRIAEY